MCRPRGGGQRPTGVEDKGPGDRFRFRSAGEGGFKEGGKLNSHTPDPKESVDLLYGRLNFVPYEKICSKRAACKLFSCVRSSVVRSSFVRHDLSVGANLFSTARKFLKTKFGSTRSISSKNRRNRSYPRDF